MELNSFAGMYVRMSGGGTLFMINTNNSGLQSTVIPYFSAGLGADFYFIKHFGIALIANYSIYFEESTLISGFLPSLGINFRF